MNVESGFELDDLRAVVRRRGKVAVVVAGLVTLAAYWIGMALPNEYESYATVLVEPQSVPERLVEAGVRQSDLTERLGIMTAQILSRSRLSRIIDDIELYQDEHETMLREQIIDLMRDRIRVEPVIPELRQGTIGRGADENINQFRIYFSDRDPAVASKVAQRLANDFIERHIDQRVEVSQKSVEFIESELERLAVSIGELEARVAGVKAANPGKLPDDLASNRERISRLTTEMALAQRQMAAAHSDEAFYRSRVAAAGTGSNDDASPGRRMELLQLQLSDYQARGYTDKHPDVLKTREEIEVLRRRLAELEARGEDPSATPSFAQQTLDAEAERAARQVGAAEEEMARLQESIDEVSARLAETPAVAEKLDALEREYQHLFRSYQDFSQRRLEATVQAQLERRQLGEQFRVLEAAFEAPEPTSPNRPLIVVIGALFGLVLGGGLAVVLEGTDSSVHNARQLQIASGLPVLASIPTIWLEADGVSQRRRRTLQILAAAGVVAFALGGGAANYAWVNGMPSLLAGEKAETPPVAEEPPGEPPTDLGEG